MIVCGCSISIYMYMGFIFLAGFLLNGYETICLVYISEISGKVLQILLRAKGERFRNYSSSSLSLSWAGAQILFTFCYVYFTSWRLLIILIMGLPILICAWLTVKWIDESPRYLVSKAKYNEARNIFRKICLKNNRPDFSYNFMDEMDSFSDQVTTLQQKFPLKTEKDKMSELPSRSTFRGYLELFQLHSFKKITFPLLYAWFFRYFVYFGITYSLGSLGGTAQNSLLVTALGEVLASCFAGISSYKIELKSYSPYQI